MKYAVDIHLSALDSGCHAGRMALLPPNERKTMGFLLSTLREFRDSGELIFELKSEQVDVLQEWAAPINAGTEIRIDSEGWGRWSTFCVVFEDYEALVMPTWNTEGEPCLSFCVLTKAHPFPIEHFWAGPGKVPDIFNERDLGILRTVFGLMAYLKDNPLEPRSAGPQHAKLTKKLSTVKSPGKRKRIERQIAALEKRTRVVYLGEITKHRNSGPRMTGAHRTPVRHWVVGHEHRFWVGPRRDPSKRRLVTRWVEGHFRGHVKADRTIARIRGKACREQRTQGDSAA